MVDDARDPIRPALGWFLLLDGGLIALGALCILPGLARAARRRLPIPSDRALRAILAAALLTHVLEGIGAAAIASRRGRDPLRWAAQSAVVGFPSLRLLLRTDPLEAP